MKVRDPVCGMEFDEDQASGRLQHAGRTFYFCTNACRAQFEAQPEKYVDA